MVGWLKNWRTAFPWIPPSTTILREVRAVMTMIPERRSVIFSLTWRIPVQTPAAAPARKERMRQNHGSTPFVMAMAVTQHPRGKVPSTERSGKSRIL